MLVFILLISLHCENCRVSCKTTVTVSSNVTAYVGETARLKCTYVTDAVPPIKYYSFEWSKEGDLVYLKSNAINDTGDGYKGRVSLAQGTQEASLLIENVNKADSGNYKCKVAIHDEGGTVEIEPVHLEVKDIPATTTESKGSNLKVTVVNDGPDPHDIKERKFVYLFFIPIVLTIVSLILSCCRFRTKEYDLSRHRWLKCLSKTLHFVVLIVIYTITIVVSLVIICLPQSSSDLAFNLLLILLVIVCLPVIVVLLLQICICGQPSSNIDVHGWKKHLVITVKVKSKERKSEQSHQEMI